MQGRVGTTVRAFAVAVGLLAVLGACDDFDGWDYSVFDVGQGVAPDVTCECGPACTGTCMDCLAGLKGKAMRFSVLTVTEPIVPTAPNPEALPEYLNGIWQEDVRRAVLNIMLYVEDVDVETRTLTLRGGAGWHDQSMDQLPKVGEEVTVVPTGYRFLAGTSGPFTVVLDDACHFELTSDPPTVGFHPGPEDIAGIPDHPNICTSEDPVIPTRNSIPVVNLTPSGDLKADCSGVLAGSLRGCIAKEAAARICAWGPAPNYDDWYIEPDETAADTPGTAYFCQHWCAPTSWLNFGGIVSMAKVPLACDSDGDGTNDGYGIAGDFEAQVIDLAEPPPAAE